MFLSGLGMFLWRAVSIVGGAVLLFSGRKRVKANPASNGNAEAAVAQVKH